MGLVYKIHTTIKKGQIGNFLTQMRPVTCINITLIVAGASGMTSGSDGRAPEPLCTFTYILIIIERFDHVVYISRDGNKVTKNSKSYRILHSKHTKYQCER